MGGGGASFTGGVQEVLLGVEVVGVGECREKQAKTEVFGGIAIGRELRNGELGRSGQAVGGVGGEKWREVGLKCGRSGEFAQGVEEGVAFVVHAGVVAGDDVGQVAVAVATERGGAVDGVGSAGFFVGEVVLEIGLIFSEIMQQAGEAGFGAGVERGGEGGREVRDVFEMRAEWLPFAGGFGQAFSLGVFGGVSVIDHAQ